MTMPQVINTNLASLTVQRSLNANQGAAATAMERLSTGLRINSAKDDAAGLAISSRMTSQINGLNQAARNAADGVSLAQTAEGALGEVVDNLQRIRELAVQSSNETNTNADRTSLQNEVSQLLLEIDRVANATDFNGTNLIDGTFTGGVFQVGADAGDSVSIASITDANTAALGSVSTNSSTELTSDANLIVDLTAVSANDLLINGTDIGALSAASSAAERAGQLVNAINNISAQTGVGASYDAATGDLTLNSDALIVITGAANDATQVGFANDTGLGAVTTTTGVDTLTVANYAGAQTAISLVDDAIATINTARGTLGAIQTRFESIVSNVQVASENLQAARSRIMDADFAAETAALTKAQILQQAGISVLSQANAQPQNVLALLQ
jgi:flagellin